MSNLCLVALGANLPAVGGGSPADTVAQALIALHECSDIDLEKVSTFWLTPAHPAGSGPDYCNAAAALRTSLSPRELLDKLHQIEAKFGRERPMDVRWQSRTLDLDLLAVEDTVLPDTATQDEWRNLPSARQAQRAPDEMILPHPRLQDRGFVLAPLAQIAPLWIHPRTGQTVVEMLAALPDDELAAMQEIALTNT